MPLQEYRKYDQVATEYYTSQPINVVRDCKAIAIINIGDTIATLNGVPVFPSATPATVRGDTFEFSGDELETFAGKSLNLSFRAPIGANQRVIIIQQYYIENYK